MSGTNLLVIALSLSITAVTLAITTTVVTETKVTLNNAVNVSTPVEGDLELTDCELLPTCDVHYSGTINVELVQSEVDAPIKVETSFDMDSIELLS